jgi:hypothetical protein
MTIVREANADNGIVTMLRAVSMFGLGGIFLWISPRLREQVFGAIGGGVSAIESYAPFSYVAGGILIFAAMMVSFRRGSRAR